MALKALLVGINYTTKSFLRLNGCVNDVYLAKEYLLEKHSVKPENIKVVVDDYNYNESNNHQSLWPTKKNLLESLTSFLKSSQAGNVLLFHYSGHGTQVTDSDGSTHEALVPLDARDCGNKFENIILDSELEKIILEHTPNKVTLYVILDCCYYVGGDIEKVRRVLLPHRASGSQSRVAIPRELFKNPQLCGAAANATEASRTMVAMMKDANEKRKEINIIAYTGGSKLDPVADATFNYKGYGAFSYFLYNTVQLNKPLQNIKIIDTVRDSIKRSNFTQTPQLVACSKIEQNKWCFLSNTEGDANTTVVMLRDLVAISGSSDIMNLSNKEIEQLHILDAAATLEVKQQISLYSKERGICVPFVAQDMARVIASVSGRTVMKITQNQAIEESICFAAASVAIRETTVRVFQQLLLDPVNGKRANVKQPDLFNLMENVVNMSIDKITRQYLPEDKIKKEFVEHATSNSIAVALPSISTILAQPIDLSMKLAELCSQITPKSASHLPATNKLIARCIDLAKQIVSAIIACDMYRLDNNKKLPSLQDMANEISHKVEFKFNDSFISQITASFVPQVEVEKVALAIVKEIAKDRVFILDQDLEDRVSEISTRFGNFISLVSPIGPTLLSSLSSHNNPFTFVESFLGSMCKVAVDDVLTGLTTNTTNWNSSIFPSSKIPILFKVAAKSVAEVSAYSTLNYLKTCNNISLSSGTLSGIVNTVAKNAVMKVFELLSNIVDKSGASGVQQDGIGKDKNGYVNVFYSLAHIAVHASKNGINSLSLLSDSPRVMDYTTKQAISNNVSSSATKFFSFLPILGAAIPMVRSALGNNQYSMNNDLLSFGTEILATSVASLIQRGFINPHIADDIVRNAIPALSSVSFTSTSSITDAVVVSIQRACERQSQKSATYDMKSIHRDVSKIAKYFESFHPMPLYSTTISTAPNFDVRSVLEGSSTFVVQQLSSFVPEGYQKALKGESRALSPFIVNIVKTSGVVAAHSLICLLRNRGVLTPSFSRYNELQECLKRLSATVAKKVIYDLLSSQPTSTSATLTSVTVLEKVSEFIVTEVAKEVELIIGSVSTTSVEAADAIADQSYYFGALLPILAAITPALIHSMVGAVSNFISSNQGLGYSVHINVQVVALATIDTICENYYLLKSKSGSQITNDNILEIMNYAIQNSRENQTTVEQAIRKAFQMGGLKGEISDLSIRSVIIRATRILDATETTRSLIDDLELEMVEPIVTMMIQQRSVGLYVPLVVKMLAKLAGTISGKSAVAVSRHLLRSKTITPDVATLFITTSLQNATNTIINMYTSSKGSRDGCSFEQMILETSQSSVERALELHLGANKGSIDVTREIRSVYGVTDISRKLGALGVTDMTRAVLSASINSDSEVSVGANPVARAAARLVREMCYFMVNSNQALRSDETKSKNIINEVNSNITTEFNNSDFISRLGSAPKPLDIIEQMVTVQLNQSFTKNGVDMPNNMSNQVKTVLGEFYELSPLPTPVTCATRGGIYDTMSPLVSSLSTGVVTELSQSMTFSSTGRTRPISPFVLTLARSIAELSSSAALEVIYKLCGNVNSITVSSILSTVARKAAQKVIELTSTAAAGTSGAASAPRWGSLLTSVLPFIVDTVVQGVSSIPGMSMGQLSRESRVTIMEAVKSASSRCVNPLLLGVTNQMFGVVQASSQSLTQTTEVTSVGSDATAAIAFILATQEVDGKFAEKFATDAATTFQRNTNKFVNEEWSLQRLEEEVSKAVFQTVSSSDNMRKRNETELRAVVGNTMPQFIPFLPPSIPVCGTQRSKDELLSKVDQQVISVLSTNIGPEFTRTIARGAAQVAAGATVDAVGSMQRTTGAYSDQLLKAALEVGVKTATVILNSYSNKSRSTTDSVVLSDIMNTCRPIIQEGVVMAYGQSNVRNIDIQSITSTYLANNTRFFGSLLPVLSTVGPSVVNTISTVLSGRSISDTSYKAYEAAALTTASLMIESKGTQELNNSMIESAVRGCVDRLNSISTASGRSGNDVSLENVMISIEQVLQSSTFKSFQTVPKLEIEGRLRTIGDCYSIPSWGKMNTSWGKLGNTSGGIAPSKPSMPVSMPPKTEYSDQVMKMAAQVLQIYNGSPFYQEELSKSAVQKTIDAVLTYPRLRNFPDTFISELAKMAGCIAAKEMQRQNPDSTKAVTLGLAVVAQLLTPNELPRSVCIGGQAR